MTKTLTRRKSGITRREFIGTVASTAAFTIVPRHVLGGTGYAAPSESLNLALIGAGGHGAFLINEVVSYSKGLAKQLGGVNIVAVCDVDERRARETVSHNHPDITDTNDAGFKRFPAARRYKDFRKLFDWEEKNIDAAVVATPDHIAYPGQCDGDENGQTRLLREAAGPKRSRSSRCRRNSATERCGHADGDRKPQQRNLPPRRRVDPGRGYWRSERSPCLVRSELGATAIVLEKLPRCRSI